MLEFRTNCKHQYTDYRGVYAYHLLGSHAHGLDRELTATHVEEVLKVRAEQVDDEDIVQALLTEVVYLGDAG